MISFRQFITELTRIRVTRGETESGADVHTDNAAGDRKAIRIPISQIKRTNEPLEKTANSEEKMKSLTDALRKGKSVPPVLVHRNQVGGYELLDGHHRYQAHLNAGKKHIHVQVVDKHFVKENAAIKHYTKIGAGYDLNQKLIKGHALTPEESSHVHDLTQFIHHNAITRPTVVYRGMGHHPGNEYHSPGFLSTSSEEGNALIFAHNHDEPHMMVIHAKAGHPVADISEHSIEPGESEHLIAPNTKIKLTSHHFEDGVHYHTGHIA